MKLFRTKPIETDLAKDTGLKKVLGAFDLVLLGIGAIIGAGIFVLTGIAAANHAGPAVVLSFVVAGMAVTFAALSYAELAASIGGAGSAYGYGYAGLGEFVAWVIGWMLILEYSVAISAVSAGWAGYVDNVLAAMEIHLPEVLTKTPSQGGWINLPAMLIILALGTLLATGAKVSAQFNAIMVFVKVATILLFIGVAFFHVDINHWTPFMPFGWEGVMTGAASIFFAYIGFDAVSTAAEETRNPQKDLPIGILGSLAICTLLYMLVAALLTGIVPYPSLDVPSPVSDALLQVGEKWASGMIAIGAIAGLTTVMLVLYFGLTRILFAISRDGLLPPFFSHINEKTGSPARVILLAGVAMATIAGFAPLNDIVELTNIGTLGAFVVVCAGVAVLRYTKPDLHRPFRTPFSPIVPILGIAFCVYLMTNLGAETWTRFSLWLTAGLIIYFTYSYRHSKLAAPEKSEPAHAPLE
ncbi:amino acid permease-associated region [Nitrosococcus halophilus Nc 4]|uniref:Amino acid permease-associated region n=1 Tax=Nitrosococcus halophilus (strain Nc4) TaxID=472759 RepID=D5C476_NITHN|nr:amino acid permease [Nitrosococcus halophilus]ADE13264.1 amino acid permease-associated region [Nitrosococcus halophilus Nc 4]